MIVKVLILFLLIIINGVFSATEMAFLSLNRYELNKELKRNKKKAKKIVALLNDSSTFLSAIQIVITLSGFLASAFAAEGFASEIADTIHISWLSTEALINILIVIITIILSYFTLVLGELVPKQIGLANSKKIAFVMVNPLYLIITFFKPFIMILGASTNFLLKILRIYRKKEEEEEELKGTIVEANLEDLEKKMLLRVFEFNDTTVEKAMTRRENVVTIDLHDSRNRIMEIIRSTKYTRFPVTENGEVIGIINIKDFLIHRNPNFELKNYVRKIEVIPHDMIIDDAFLLLNQKYEPIAKVMKDGIWVGIVTLEDIIEEVIGNVFDEYDSENEF